MIVCGDAAAVGDTHTRRAASTTPSRFSTILGSVGAGAVSANIGTKLAGNRLVTSDSARGQTDDGLIPLLPGLPRLKCVMPDFV